MLDTVLSSVVTGVHVLTAQHQGKINGTTVSWVTPVSYDPLLIMVSLAGVRVSHDLVKSSGLFGLNVLGQGQEEIARHFGLKTARELDKFEGMSYTTSELSLPIIDGAVAFIECRVVDSCRAGEHTLFIGEVVSAKILDESKKPLVFKHSDYF